MITGLYPLLWVDDVDAVADWAIDVLGLEERWRAAGEDGHTEHAELLWHGQTISINIKATPYAQMGPAGIAVRIDDRDLVEAMYEGAKSAGAQFAMALAESPVAYSFTVLDPAGNQWWVHAETGFLDELR